MKSQENIIELCGNKYSSLLRGYLEYQDNLVSVYAKHKGLIKPQLIFNNIPMEVVETERELIMDNKPTGFKKITIRQDFKGDINFSYVNSKLHEQFNSLYNENLALKREINTLRKKLFDFKGNDLFKEQAYKDLKWAGKVRSVSYFGSEGAEQQPFNRFGYGRGIMTIPPEM